MDFIGDLCVKTWTANVPVNVRYQICKLGEGSFTFYCNDLGIDTDEDFDSPEGAAEECQKRIIRECKRAMELGKAR